MKKTAWLILLPSLVLASVAVALIVLINMGDPVWTCNCDSADHWHYVGPNGAEESEMHLDATGHITSCKRTDWAAKVMDRVYGLIFPGHEA
jgi:hypothetical protein